MVHAVRSVRCEESELTSELSTPVDLPDRLRVPRPSPEEAKRSVGKVDWSSWPTYDSAAAGLRNYWYPIRWGSQVADAPQAVEVCGEKLVIQRDSSGVVHALRDRCPHRGVRLSQGTQEFPDTVSCPYHGWTFRLSDGELVAVITDGPDSPMCGKVSVQTYPCEERIGLVWVYIGDGIRAPHDLDDQLPEELVGAPPMAIGGHIEERDGDWRIYAENAFDEGHAKFVHRRSLWRTFKMMPAWNKIHIERHGRWIYRVEDERHWSAEFPGLGTWSNERWWKIKPKQQQGKFLGNTGGNEEPDPYIASRQFPGFASLSVPGVLRIAYPQFIHYEFYVPISPGRTKYVGVMVQFKTGLDRLWFYTRYLFGIRWLFHGQFSGQDHWMVSETDAPPERLYRPDVSLLEWRRLVEAGNPFDQPEA
jgi:phenylpropionate dioxygenase-like ring-hydroxylating dioxygenase large terminal subunit